MEKLDRNSNNSWISSSFENENKISFATEKTPKRKRKLEENCVKKKGSQAIKVLEPDLKQDSQAWVEQYSPKTKEQLAVNKKKIVQVEGWLKQALSTSSFERKASILLLTGPAGCGKSATVKVLSNELNLDLKEWSNEYQLLSHHTGGYGSSNFITNVSQMALFNTFLLHGNKYPAVFIKYNCQRLILVEEYPNTYLKDVSLFHSVLRKYQKMGRCPLIFIISDNSRGQSLEQLLFPKHILEELNVSVINFNPAASTMLLKILQRICQDYNLLVDGSKTRKSVIENIIACSSGDIRNAINCLQFMHNEKSQHPFRKDSKKKSGIAETCNAVSSVGRDTSLFLFHSLGKILYCKRENALCEDAFSPKMAYLNRPPLKENPEEVFCKTSTSSVAFSLFLHQNYLDFMDKIENISECCTYFGDGDIICSDWTENSLQDYSASIVSRSLMFHLYSSTINHKWKPLHKPQWYNKQKMYNTNFAALRDIYQRWKVNTRELQTQLLPYLLKFSPLKLTIDERKFVSKYKVFTSSCGTSASAKSLGEREGFEDIPVPDSAIVGNILCKMPFDIEENEEDHLIEEYDE